MKKANDYMYDIRIACGTKLMEYEGVYSGREGHLRLARECGYALTDFTEIERKEIITGSYSSIYVIACNLKPLLNAKEWVEELMRGYKQAKYTGKKLHDEIEMLAETEDFYKQIYKDFYYDEINQQTYNTKNEVIEILNDMVEDFKIKNIIDFRRVVANHTIIV